MEMDIEKNKAKKRIMRWQILADDLISRDKAAFIKDINDNYYFGNLLFCGEKTIEIECFEPEQKKGQRFNLSWYSIVIFDEYREEM